MRSVSDNRATYLDFERVVGEDEPEQDDGGDADERLERDRVERVLPREKRNSGQHHVE